MVKMERRKEGRQAGRQVGRKGGREEVSRYYGILFNHKKEGNPVIYDNIDGP